MSGTVDARARDEQTKRIQESIGNVEKHFGDLCNMFGNYARKVAKLRDKADVLVRGVADYADTETPSLKKGVKQFAEQLAKIQDYRQAEVERLEAKVIKPLKGYSAVVQRKREDVKAAECARTRGSKQMLQLERTRQRNPADRQVIVSFTLVCYRQTASTKNSAVAESELQRATIDEARTTRQLEETIDDFEKQKIRDIKRIMCDFASVEMSFHAKALELLTLAYQSIHSVDEDDDLEVFRSSLHPPDYPARLDIVRANSLDGTASSFLTPSAAFQQQRASGRQDEDEEEEESEEEEEEEEEVEESDDETR
ncbi:CBY1-interacting BAR domain-containing protein 1 isoform X5 [Phycodurus eques]|uniref:CBY1-interacting BAR domain-containing protein 1 isoform X5 n=1 Tax=Phycodurus eques TaxID=693459 RepID=UPI002ACED140|nr:CBY1-interacting BAR domain-containing protein 1 isoform X5 [Phycodurus eques]